MATDSLDIADQRRLSFENDRVKFLMNCLLPDGPKKWEPRKRKWVEAVRAGTYGNPYLTFLGLSKFWLDEFGPLPLRMGSDYRCNRDATGTYLYIFRFDKTYMVSNYFRERRQHIVNRGVYDYALVFNTPDVKGGTVLHNLPDATHRGSDTVITTKMVDPEARADDEYFGSVETLVMQPYKSFAQWLALKWSQGEPLRTEHHEDDTAELTKALPASAVLLLQWLRKHSRRTGDVEMRLTRPEIVTGSGLTLTTVQNSLNALKEANRIETRKGENCLHLRLL